MGEVSEDMRAMCQSVLHAAAAKEPVQLLASERASHERAKAAVAYRAQPRLRAEECTRACTCALSDTEKMPADARIRYVISQNNREIGDLDLRACRTTTINRATKPADRFDQAAVRSAQLTKEHELSRRRSGDRGRVVEGESELLAS